MDKLGMKNIIRKVAFVAPSGAFADPAVLDRAAAYFSAHGMTVTAPDSTWSRFQRFAGTDDERVEALHSVSADKSVQLVMAARGGYGLTRILHRVQWKKLVDSQKTFVGYSDFTAMNLALLAHGATSLHGPSAISFGGDKISSFTEDHFWPMIETNSLNIKVRAKKQPKVDTSGILWGGNLAVFCGLLGTRFMPQINKGILFFEDVSEHPYRIERMLTQLKHAGVLDRQRAIVLGQFTDYTLGANDNGFDMDSVVQFIRSLTKVPVLTDLPFGHIEDKITLPYGQKVQLTSVTGGYKFSND